MPNAALELPKIYLWANFQLNRTISGDVYRLLVVLRKTHFPAKLLKNPKNCLVYPYKMQENCNILKIIFYSILLPETTGMLQISAAKTHFWPRNDSFSDFWGHIWPIFPNIFPNIITHFPYTHLLGKADNLARTEYISIL